MKESTNKGSKRKNMHNDSDYKTRNILTPEQRIAVLREYDKKPVYQAIANKFKCSAKQIKTIVLKRKINKITTMQTDESPSSQVADAANNKQSMQMLQSNNDDKIIFMNKVVYEFIQRATYYMRPLDALAVMNMADQVKEAIAIANFKPNINWLKNFMVLHKFRNFDLKVLTKRFAFLRPKEQSLRCYDIIEYVRLQAQSEKMRNSQNKNNQHTITVIIEEPEPEKNSKLDRVIQPQFEENATAPIPEISNLAEAMNYLRALQDYALLQENFRAVGLLTQVEEVIRNPPNSQDFEES